MIKPALYKNQPVRSFVKREGFALVSTVTVMILLMMIGLGIITLSSLSSKESSQERYIAEAKANARLALSIAISKLQQHAGPDQRVTATASILDTDPATADIDGVNNPNWVGVWKTNGLKADKNSNTPFIQVANNGPLTDTRQSGYTRENENLEWLVSGENPDPTQEPQNPVLLLSTGDDKSDVYAEKVKVNKNGSYAYWVSDEGVKANIAIPADENKTDPSLSNNESMYQLLSPNRFGLGNVFDNYDNLDKEEAFKILTQNQTALANIGSSPVDGDIKKAVKLLGHDLTTNSYSVLSDSAQGGLKKNLSAYIYSNGTVPTVGSMPGISDTTPILTNMPQRDVIGPKFGAIRDWFNLRNSLSGSRGNQTIDMTYANYDAGFQTTAIENFIKQPIQPTLIEATYQTSYTYDPINRDVIELIYPRVSVWNPYNVKLKTPDMYVYFEFKGDDYYDMNYKYRDANNVLQDDKIRLTINYNFGYAADRRFIFTIPGTTFEPGECLQFSVPSRSGMLGGKAAPYTNPGSGVNNNKLSAAADPTDMYCFYRYVKTSNGAGSNVKLKANYQPNTITINYAGGIVWHGDQPSQSVYFMASMSGSGNPTHSTLGSTSFPAIQRYYLDNYSRGNNGRWLPGYNPGTIVQPVSQHLSSNIPPVTIIGYGMRWKHFYECYSNRVYGDALREPWYSAPLVQFNVRARHISRWDSDNMFGQRYTGASGTTAGDTTYGSGKAHLYSWGPISQTRQFPAWTDSEVVPHYYQGRYRSAPFSNNTFTDSEQVFPLFDLPDREIAPQSLGQFQHVQFSAQVWHPSYIIGTGICSPYVLSPQTTSMTYQEQQASWADKLNRLYIGNNDRIHLLTKADDNAMVYDSAFETNNFLWDKFFLSSLSNSQSANGWNNGKWDVTKPMPNARMIPNPYDPSSNSFTKMTDYHQAANSLMLKGGFNVNSTSKIAWESLLRSFNGIKAPSRNGSSYSSNPFSSLLVTELGAGTANSASDTELWGGYRDLTDDEISLLAEQIVVQVKKRAPFIGVADFVNRRLDQADGKDDEIEFFGALQAAINMSGINDRLDSSGSTPDDFSLPNAQEAVSNYEYGATYWGAATRTPHALAYGTFQYNKPGSSDPTRISKAEGAPGYLMQNDLLQQLGSVLTARSDTFKIRAYGESLSDDGKIMARVWCEATVQRIPAPINPDEDHADLDPVTGVSSDFGRKFVVTNFRWINNEQD